MWGIWGTTPGGQGLGGFRRDTRDVLLVWDREAMLDLHLFEPCNAELHPKGLSFVFLWGSQVFWGAYPLTRWFLG